MEEKRLLFLSKFLKGKKNKKEVLRTVQKDKKEENRRTKNVYDVVRGGVPGGVRGG